MAPSHIDKDITANYEMENLELASGGFGKVFRATDRKHPERRVAIKSMLLSSARRREMSEKRGQDHATRFNHAAGILPGMGEALAHFTHTHTILYICVCVYLFIFILT